MSLPPEPSPYGPRDAAAAVHCPYCGEAVEIVLDSGGGARQDYIEDCEVCCRPWQVSVRYRGGTAEVTLSRSD